LPKLIKSHIERGESVSDVAERTGWRGLKPFADFLGVSEDTISTYLPQKYKDKVKSDAAKTLRAAKPALAKKAKKATKILKETRKAVEKAPLAEEKREETGSFIKTQHKSDTTGMQPLPISVLVPLSCLRKGSIGDFAIISLFSFQSQFQPRHLSRVIQSLNSMVDVRFYKFWQFRQIL